MIMKSPAALNSPLGESSLAFLAVSSDSARLGVHLRLKINQRPLTDLDKSLPGAVKVHNQVYDRRKGQDYRQSYERPVPSGQS